MPPEGDIIVDPEQTTTYTLSAEGPGGCVSKGVTVTCLPPEVEIAVGPGTITEGRSATLTWSVDHAAEQFVEPAIGSVEPEGSVEVRPAVTTTYWIGVSGRGGTASAQAELVVVNPPSIAVVEATAFFFYHNGTAWEEQAEITSGAAGAGNSFGKSVSIHGAAIEPDIGTVNQNGSRTIPPTQTTIYTLAASGPGGDVASTATVEVRPRSPISLQITYPVDGAEIAGAAVSVKEAVGNFS